jgi:hypothetical protein
MTRGWGCEWYQLNCYDFAHNRSGFLDTLKELLLCFKSQKLVSAFRAKKRGACFEVTKKLVLGQTKSCIYKAYLRQNTERIDLFLQ